MTYLETLLLVVHLVVAAVVCGFVLMQHGKGADMGAAFGSGSSGSLFGAAGSANFLSRTTAVLAAVFFVTSLGLTWYGSSRVGPRPTVQQGVMDRLPPSKAGDIPAAPGAPAKGAAPAGEPGKAAVPSAPSDSKAGEVPK